MFAVSVMCPGYQVVAPFAYYDQTGTLVMSPSMRAGLSAQLRLAPHGPVILNHAATQAGQCLACLYTKLFGLTLPYEGFCLQ